MSVANNILLQIKRVYINKWISECFWPFHRDIFSDNIKNNYAAKSNNFCNNKHLNRYASVMLR